MSIKRLGPWDNMDLRNKERIALHFVMHQLKETGLGEKSIRHEIRAAIDSMGLTRDDVEFFIDSISTDLIRESVANFGDRHHNEPTQLQLIPSA